MQNISFLQDLAKKTGINLGDIFKTNEPAPEEFLGLGGNIAALPAIDPTDPRYAGLQNLSLAPPPAPAPPPIIPGATGADYVPPIDPTAPPPIAVAPHRYADPNRFAGLNVPEPQQPPVVFPAVAPMAAPTTREMLPAVNFGEPMAASRRSANLEGALPQIAQAPPGRTAENLFQPQYSDSQEYEPPTPRSTAGVATTAPYDPTPELTESEKKLLDINNPENYRPPTYMNTSGGPDNGKVSSDPAVVKSWGKNNAARIDEGGKSRNKKWSLLEKIGSAALGWAQGGLIGGIKGGTDRNYFPKMKDQFERQELLPKIAQEQQIEAKRTAIGASKAKVANARQELLRKVQKDKNTFDNQTRSLDLQGQRIADAKQRYKVYVDENGYRWRQFLNDPSRKDEPIMDATGKLQDQDPNFQLHDYKDPNTGEVVQIRGDKLATLGAQIISADAARQQTVNIKESDMDFEAQKINATAKMNYSNRVIEQMKAMATANKTRTEDLDEMNAMNTVIQAAATKLDTLDPESQAYADAKKEFDKLYREFFAKVGAVKGGTELIDTLRGLKIEPPQDVVPKKIAVVKVGGNPTGKPVPLSQDRAKLFQ